MRLSLLFVICLLLNFSFNKVLGQCTTTTDCDQIHNTCASLVATTVAAGTASDYNILCISPPAGCGNITIGNVTLSQYSTIRICTSSPGDTVKFIGQFGASGAGPAATNDNTRRFEVQGNVQLLFGSTVNFNTRIVIDVASSGTLDLRPFPSGPNPLLFGNSDSIYNKGKILSNGPVNFAGPVSNQGSIDAKSISVAKGIKNNGSIHSQSTISLASGANVINNGSIITEGSFTSSGGSFFDNNSYWLF